MVVAADPTLARYVLKLRELAYLNSGITITIRDERSGHRQERTGQIARDVIAKCPVFAEVVRLRQVGHLLVDCRRRRTALGVELEVAEYERVLGAARER